MIWLMVFHVTAFHVTRPPFSEMACRRGLCQPRTCCQCGFDGVNKQMAEINAQNRGILQVRQQSRVIGGVPQPCRFRSGRRTSITKVPI